MALVLLPSLAALPLADESFHIFLLILVAPTSAFALTLGCRRHRQWKIMFCGIAGLLTLLLAVIAGHDILGEFLEKLLTMLGACLVAISHVLNFKECKTADCDH